ncbi:heat stress transcription factor A-4c-like [Bidens hawaiensis]|uniref:heat stress transcription factor A-4c-like n=1 Tax=Bidens hawaiensis TaxID=980011 RepID=UPI00404A8D2A
MEGSQQGGSSSSPPFLTKTYEMMDDPLTDHIVSWSHTGTSFVVWNPPEFAGELLPKFFKHNNFSSFVRQLNTYGFKKIDPDQWEFANDEFIKGQRHLLKNIHRRKPIHSHSTPPQGTLTLSPSEKQEFEDEVNKLKQETSSLRFQLQTLTQENKENEHKLSFLHERVHTIQLTHKKMISFLAQFLEKHSSSRMQHIESNSKKRRLLISNYLQAEADEETENLEINTLVKKLDLSLKFWVDIVNDVNIIEDFRVKSKTSGIDVNVEPDGGGGGGGKEVAVKTGANDVFWEQFLTETPGGGDTQEVQSVRRDVIKQQLWSANNLNKITEKMGNLSPLGKLDVR